MTKDAWDAVVKIVGILTGGGVVAYGIHKNYNMSYSDGQNSVSFAPTQNFVAAQNFDPFASQDFYNYVQSELQFFKGLTQNAMQTDKLLQNVGDYVQLTWQNVNNNILFTVQDEVGQAPLQNPLNLDYYDWLILQNPGAYIQVKWQNVNGSIVLTWQSSIGYAQQLTI